MRAVLSAIALSMLVVAGVSAYGFTGPDWQQTDQIIAGSPLVVSRTLGYDSTTSTLLIAETTDAADVAGVIDLRRASDGTVATPATISVAGLPFTGGRNLPFFGIGVSSAGVVYSFLNDAADSAPPGDAVVRWPSITGAPTVIATLAATESAIFFPRNIDVHTSGSTDYLVEAGSADDGPINVWSWSGSSFALVDQIPPPTPAPGGLVPTGQGSKSGVAIDAIPPTWALGCGVVSGGSNGAHLFQNTAGGLPGTWVHVGDLEPAGSPCLDVGFDVTLAPYENPVMFAMFPDLAVAGNHVVHIAMYSLGRLNEIASIDLPTGDADPESGGAMVVDPVNNQLYYFWRTTTNSANATFGRLSYTVPITTAVGGFELYN